MVDEDKIQLQAFRDYGHRLARKDDLVEAVDQAWKYFLLDALFRSRARLISAPQSVTKVLADLFAAHDVCALNPFPFAVLAKKAIPFGTNRIDDVRDDHRSLQLALDRRIFLDSTVNGLSEVPVLPFVNISDEKR